MKHENRRELGKSAEEVEDPTNLAQERRIYRDAALQNADYVLENPELKVAALRLLKCSVVLNAQEIGYPILFASEPLLKRLGRPRQELIGGPWDLLFDTEADAERLDAFRDRLQARRSVAGVVPLRCSTADALEGVLCLVPVFDHNKHLTYFFGTLGIPDATTAPPSDDLQQTLRQVEKALDAVVLTDEQSETAAILWINLGFETLTGFRQCEVFRAPLSSLSCQTDPTESHAAIRAAQDASSFSALIYKKDGTPFQAAIFSFPLAQSQESATPRCLHIFIDVTAQAPEKLGSYILGRVIGSGASGVVRIAKAIQTRNRSSATQSGMTAALDETVAIKVVDATKFRSISEIELIQDEISALSTVKHENIVNLREVLFENSVFYFVMDFCSGGSLASHMRSRDQRLLPEDEARDVFKQITSAVAYCHRRRVIHRDLKPENILLDGNGRIQVADFGLSAIAAPCGSLSNLCGTPEFLAPEVISSTEYDGATADIWSLGIILHELLTGSTPFKGNSRTSLFRAIQNGSLAPLPDALSTSCQELVSRMLTKDPEQRITMEEILSDPWMTHTTSLDSHVATEGSQHIPAVHESAKLTLVDWGGDGDDAISNAIVSGDYSRSPSIVIVRAAHSESSARLSRDLEALRASTSQESTLITSLLLLS